MDGIAFVKYTHTSLVVIMTKLCNIMLSIGIVPDDFGLGIISPIPNFIGYKSAIFSTLRNFTQLI